MRPCHTFLEGVGRVRGQVPVGGMGDYGEQIKA